MPDTDNNLKRSDEPDRQTIAALYALMDLHPAKAAERVNTVTFQEKVKRERDKEMALRK